MEDVRNSTSGSPQSEPPGTRRFAQRVADKSRDHREPSVLIIALGDSVTQGATVMGVNEPDRVYHYRVKRLLEARHPKAVFSVINSGIGGDTVRDGTARLERDVLRHQPDLVLVGFGLNDASEEPGRLEQFEADLDAMVQTIQHETDADVILLTPSFMATRDNDAIAPEHQSIKHQLIARQTSGALAHFAQAIRNVGRARACPVADVHAAWEALAQQGVDTTAMLANGLNHPTGEAHEITARCIMRAINAGDKNAANEREWPKFEI